MPYSYAVYTGNGVTTQFTVPFPYIRREHVVVSLDYVSTTFTWINNTTVEVSPAPTNGERVEVRRVTPVNNPLVDFTDGSTLVAADLDINALQQTYINQEQDDQIQQGIYVDSAGNLTAGNQVLKDLLDPVDPQDAATKNWVETAGASPLVQFRSIFYGALATDPAVDPYGNARTEGDLYFNSTLDQMRVFNGTTWQEASADATITRFKFTAVGGETSLSGNDDNAQSLTYNVGLEMVYINGALMTRGVDYVATTGSSITGLVALSAADLVEVVVFSQIDAIGSIPSANSTFLQSGTGAVQRTVDSKLKDVVSVKDFGAVGDGVANDTVAIQTALSSGASEIFFPSGEYLMGISDQLVIGSDIKLVGASPDQVSVKIDTAATFNDNYLVLVNGNNVAIENISFKGGRPIATDSKSTEKLGKIGIIQLRNGSNKVSDINIHNCKFFDSYAKGIEVYADNLIVSNCSFSRIGRFQFDVAPFDAAISTWLFNSLKETNISVINCNFSYVGQYGVLLRDSDEVFIANNNVEHCSAIGFGNALSKNIRIKDNFIRYVYNGGIDMQQCSYCQIEGNTLELCGNGTLNASGQDRAFQSIYFGDDFETNQSHHAVIANNVIYGSFNSSIISGTPPSDYLFTGQGIELVSAYDVVVKGNVIDGIGRGYTDTLLQPTKEGVGIKTGGNCSNVVICNNTISNTKTDGIFLGVGSQTNILVNNNSIAYHGRHGIQSQPNSVARLISIIDNNILDGKNVLGLTVSADIYVTGLAVTYGLLSIKGNTCTNTARDTTANASATVFTTHGIYFFDNDSTNNIALGNFILRDNLLNGHLTNEIEFSSGVNFQFSGPHWRAIDNNRVGMGNNATGVISSIPGLDTQISLEFNSTNEPSSGYFTRGSVAWKTFPESGQPVGWVCTSSGTPGTWKSFGTVAS
jgi:hypothetical protein